MAKTIRQKAVAKERHEERRQYIQEFKKSACADCGNHYPEICMDFHHINEDIKTHIEFYNVTLNKQLSRL